LVSIKIGTRASPLALAQAHETRDLLAATHPSLAGPDAIKIVALTTTGDKVQDRPLSEVGGKGVFTKELDEALFDGRIDVGVHSMKDVPTWLPDGLVLPCMLAREDVRDVIVSPRYTSFAAMPAGSVVGTTSLRRQSQVLARYPELKVIIFRGNVQTRLRKLDEGEADATLLALAGLNRLGMAHVAAAVLEADDLLPAVGQGAIGMTCRADDVTTIETIAALDHGETSMCVNAERAMLDVLDGSCKTPIAGLATLSDDRLRMHIRGLVAEADGTQIWTAERTSSIADSEFLGRDVGAELRTEVGEAFFVRPVD
jgi:hydroxymethylbilane synthase